MATAPALPAGDSYATAHPFPHVVFEELFDVERLRTVAAEAEAGGGSPDPAFYAQKLKATISRREAIGPATLALIDDLNGPGFIRWLEGVTGIAGLHPDPALQGGGVHRSTRGAFLKVHTDFNWHADLAMHRRVNLIVYLNEGWRDEWAGHLELWTQDMAACAVRIAPELGRVVIFSTTDDSYHGHPEPLACPAGVTRKSVALYYYSRERPARETRFGPSSMTNYRARPGERFASFRYAVHRALLNLPGARRLIGR